MWASERHARLVALIGNRRRLLTIDAAKELDVSRETIRRDFLDLERGGMLRRVHGGAVAVPPEYAPEPAFAERRTTDVEAKNAVARHAVGMLDHGATIFVDAGTTTLAFAAQIIERPDLRILTNSIEIAGIAPPVARGQVLLLGGTPHPDVPGAYGEVTLTLIDRFLADYAIISPVGISADRGASDFLLNEAEVARAMLSRAKRNIFLCTAPKLGTESRVSICSVDEIDMIVTDCATDLRLPSGLVVVAN